MNRYLERVAAIVVPRPLERVGTGIDERAARSIQARIDRAVDAGARLLHGGERDGALLTPTVLDHVPPDADLVAQETFGPVAPIIRVPDLDRAIRAANATPYALSNGVVACHRRRTGGG